MKTYESCVLMLELYGMLLGYAITNWLVGV